MAAGGDGVNFPVVVVDTDVQAAAGQAHCTLLRIRGWVHMMCSPSDPDQGRTAILGGCAVHEDDNPNSPESWGAVDTYTQEDVLWTAGAMVHVPSIVQTGFDWGYHFDIDIKSKRRLRSGQSVIVSFNTLGNDSGPDLNVVGAIRALVKLT